MASSSGSARRYCRSEASASRQSTAAENARADRNLFALEPVRIAGAVPLFVMAAHDRRHRIGELHALQNLGAHHRVDLHLLELFRRQAPGLGDDVLGHRQLADVVQQRRGSQGFQVVRSQVQFFADLDGVDLHALQMVVRGVILGFDGQRQRFDGAQVQGRHLLGVLLFVLQPSR